MRHSISTGPPNRMGHSIRYWSEIPSEFLEYEPLPGEIPVIFDDEDATDSTDETVDVEPVELEVG